MQISTKSIWYKLAYCHNIMHNRPEDIVQMAFFMPWIIEEGLGFVSPPIGNISLCKFAWRILLSPLFVLYTFVAVPLVSLVFWSAAIGFIAVFGPFVAVGYGIKWLFEKIGAWKPLNTDLPSPDIAKMAKTLYDGFKKKYCPSITIVQEGWS